MTTTWKEKLTGGRRGCGDLLFSNDEGGGACCGHTPEILEFEAGAVDEVPSPS